MRTPAGGSQTHSPVMRLAYIGSPVRGSMISTHSHLYNKLTTFGGNTGVQEHCYTIHYTSFIHSLTQCTPGHLTSGDIFQQ